MGSYKSAQHPVGADDSVGPINAANSPQISGKRTAFCGRTESSAPTPVLSVYEFAENQCEIRSTLLHDLSDSALPRSVSYDIAFSINYGYSTAF